MKYISIEKLNTFAVMLWSKISSNFVRKESGKGLSNNNYTTEEKNKLRDIDSKLLVLGETQSTAYSGDKGKIAYDHSQGRHARLDAAAVGVSTTNGCIIINGKEEKVYLHPEYTEKSSGLYKIKIDASGHVSSVTQVTKADITALGIPGQDTNTTYALVSTAAAGLMSPLDKARLDELIGISESGFYKHPEYATRPSGLYKITVDSLGHISAVAAVTKSDITALGIPGQDTDTVFVHPNSGITAGTYRNITVNAQGHVTAGTNPTTLAGYGITDAASKSHNHVVANITDLETATDAEIDSIIAGTFV